MPDIPIIEGEDVLTIPWTSATDLDASALRIVEAVDEAARKRSRRHTTVYSVRPLDEEELERIGAYVDKKLEGVGEEWIQEASETNVRIVVDDNMLEGTLQVDDDPDLETIVDESLIMGIKIVRGDTVIDASLKRQLEDLRLMLHS